MRPTYRLRGLPVPLHSLTSQTRFHSRNMSSSIYVVPINPERATSAAHHLEVDKLLASVPQNTNKPSKAGTTHLFYGRDITAIASLGPKWSKASSSENVKRELVRTAVGSAVNAIKGLGEGVEGWTVKVDVSQDGVDARDAAVAAHLASYKFDHLKTTTDPSSQIKPGSSGKLKLKFEPLHGGGEGVGEGEGVEKAWKEGEVYAEAQNLARTLMELPANMLTPTLFAERIQQE